ncbi:MAG: NAD-dependent epimerase/dehydratase family protein [Sphingomonadaceae bacterium]|nr:NAD-dependent epimerase/dehydratase family protein [Sphingomonadaceae bacterium]
MRILITGGAGFIGGTLIARLAGRGGHEIVAFDNESLGRREDIADLDCRFVAGDIRDGDALAAALDGVDAVVHLAADTRVIPSIENPAHNFDANVRGSFTLLEAMRAAGVKRLVSASTGGAIVGAADPPVSEAMPPAPLSPYGASKLAVEGYCSAYAASYGMACASLRFSNVYGPRSFRKGSVVALFIRQMLKRETLTIHGDGSQTRDYVFADDLADGIIAAIDRGASGVFQLGTGVPTALDDLVAMLHEVSGREIPVEYRPFRAGEIVHTWCDIACARDVLGYDPATPLREGLARTWVWFVDNRARLGV